MPKSAKKAKQAFWERGYLAHGYWLGKERLGQVKLVGASQLALFDK